MNEVPTPAEVAREVLLNPSPDNQTAKWFHACALTLAAEVLRLTGTPDERDQGIRTEQMTDQIEVDDSALSDDQMAEVEALLTIEQWRRLAVTEDGPSELLHRLASLGWQYVEPEL